MKKIACCVMLLFLGPLAGFSEVRDPFETVLPQDTSASAVNAIPTSTDVNPPSVKIEGILWGTDQPAAIIDGEVYKVGDTLKTVNAKLCRIEKDSVFVDYNNKIFEIGSPKKKEGK
jgi:type II secretory pathway component PulC